MRAPNETTILVVDDDDLLRGAIAADFKRKGFQVFEAPNGTDAFKIARENKIDIILSDVRMPNGDGIELLKNIKEHNNELPVVMFVTGFADMTLEEAYDLGADAVFSKPFNRKALFATVLRAVSDKNEIWSPRHYERVDADLGIHLATPTSEIHAQVVNIGRGGVFVSLRPPYPQIGELVKFQIKGIVSAEGKGVVRWVRSQAATDFPAGCGIEFIELSDSCKKQVIQIITTARTKKFIPKT